MTVIRARRFALVLVASALALAGCKVRLIGDYDQAIDQGVTNAQQQVELRLALLQSRPSTAFDAAFYDGIKANMAVLRTRASSLPKYGIIVQQLANLDSQFVLLRRLDSISPRPVPAALVTAAESGIAVSVESILKLELALKRGDTP